MLWSAVEFKGVFIYCNDHFWQIVFENIDAELSFSKYGRLNLNTNIFNGLLTSFLVPNLSQLSKNVGLFEIQQDVIPRTVESFSSKISHFAKISMLSISINPLISDRSLEDPLLNDIFFKNEAKRFSQILGKKIAALRSFDFVTTFPNGKHWMGWCLLTANG